jgi:hypothetical protein
VAIFGSARRAGGGFDSLNFTTQKAISFQ